MISIIIPTLNEEKIIEKTLKNLKEISAFPAEIIISDGRSQDRTLEIAKKYSDKVVVYEGKERQTIGGGRNLGAKKAEGEYLLFLDADVSIPDINSFLQSLVEEFQKNNLVAATVRLKVSKEEETISDKIFSALAINWIHIFYNNIVKIGSSSGEFQFIRKESFEKVGGFDERLVAAEDFDMFMRLAKIGKTRMINRLTVYHTGRRFHKVGWPRILWTWFANYIHMLFFKKTRIKEWSVIR